MVVPRCNSLQYTSTMRHASITSDNPKQPKENFMRVEEIILLHFNADHGQGVTQKQIFPKRAHRPMHRLKTRTTQTHNTGQRIRNERWKKNLPIMSFGRGLKSRYYKKPIPGGKAAEAPKPRYLLSNRRNANTKTQTHVYLGLKKMTLLPFP